MMVHQDDEHHVSVAASVKVGRRVEHELVAGARQLHVHRGQRQVTVGLKQHRIEQGNIDVLTFASAVAMADCGDRGQRTMQSTQIVG